jgi:inosine-uridine nucleoside N-ribohydrolase
MGAPIHVVVDGGLDDALALGVVVGLAVPMVQVVATEGSVSLATTGRATRRLLDTFGSSVPVRLGVDRALGGPYPEGRDPFHGLDAFGGQVSLLNPADPPAEPLQALNGPVLVAERADIAAVTARILEAVARLA